MTCGKLVGKSEDDLPFLFVSECMADKFEFATKEQAEANIAAIEAEYYRRAWEEYQAWERREAAGGLERVAPEV